MFAKYEASQPGAVRVVMKDFPLESECNSNVATTLHAAACEAAVAVRLAREKKLAEPLEEWLYLESAGHDPRRPSASRCGSWRRWSTSTSGTR